MVSPKTERREEKLLMNPNAAKNGKQHGSTKQARGKPQEQVVAASPRATPTERASPKLNHSLYALYNKGKEKIPFSVLSVSLALNVILIIVVIGIGIVIGTTSLGRSCEVLPPTLPSPSTTTECCPDGWIGYQRKCYYFSEREENWKNSQNCCASFNASLVVIDSPKEMSFLARCKSRADHWIGLKRIDDQEPWRWINDTIFNNWFEIRGGGKHAYINDQGVASSSGQTEQYWICSKPVHQ